MKKKVYFGISVILLLTLLSFTTPIKAADYANHSFSEDHFAIEVDLIGAGNWANPTPEDPDLVSDLLVSTATTADRNPNEDLDFFMAYMNSSGIETAYSALEKMEFNLTFGDLLKPEVYDVISALSSIKPEYVEALEASIFEINATAPFQQLVQHYETPPFMGSKDVFVTNNFMCLVAYSAGTGTDATKMDMEDELYIGYTFSVQQLTKAINDVLTTNGSTYEIGDFNYKPSFTKIADDEYKFGIEYSNMFVLWQKIDEPLKGINIFGPGFEAYMKTVTNGIVFGQNIAAATVLDYVSYEYEFKTEETTDALGNDIVLGTVTTHYDIGETNFLVLREDTIPTANWNHTPFLAAPQYTFDVPAGLAGQTITGLPAGIPGAVTIIMPNLSFYADDDAKARIHMQNGFGLTVATATSTFGVGVSDPSFADNTGSANPTLDMLMGGNTFYYTNFTGKANYKLKGLQTLMGIDPSVDRPVIILPFTPIGWAIKDNVAKEYFRVEFELAYRFTKLVAGKLSSAYTAYPGSASIYMANMLYFTFTEFPEWYGGEIIHDPAYSAVAAMAAVGETTTPGDTTGPTTSSEPSGVPGFEGIVALLALPPLYTLYRKRRR